LASFALFDDDPGRVNTLAGELERLRRSCCRKRLRSICEGRIGRSWWWNLRLGMLRGRRRNREQARGWRGVDGAERERGARDYAGRSKPRTYNVGRVDDSNAGAKDCDWLFFWPASWSHPYGAEANAARWWSAKAFTVPAHETYTLANGMKVTLVPYGNIPKVTVSLALQSGSIDEQNNSWE